MAGLRRQGESLEAPAAGRVHPREAFAQERELLGDVLAVPARACTLRVIVGGRLTRQGLEEGAELSLRPDRKARVPAALGAEDEDRLHETLVAKAQIQPLEHAHGVGKALRITAEVVEQQPSRTSSSIRPLARSRASSAAARTESARRIRPPSPRNTRASGSRNDARA